MKLIVALFFLALSFLSQAGIQLDSTRVIYPADKREVTLALANHADKPRLIQAWVDSGDTDTSPQKSTTPFIVIPPIFRLNPDKGQMLRIIFTGGNIPQDREYVFWLNVLEVQPKPAVSLTADNAIKMSVRVRLKLFYRPKGLPGSPEKAVSLLRWRLVPEGKHYVLECENPGAYNVSFNHIGFKGTPVKEEEKQSGMCPAKRKQRFSVTGSSDAAGGRLTLTTIDDLGGYHDCEARYLP